MFVIYDMTKTNRSTSMDMNIAKYMAFVKTAEYGSFTKAAQMLNYSQSGISRMIGDLERGKRTWNFHTPGADTQKNTV